MKTTKRIQPGRRGFLLAAGLGTAGVAAAVVAKTGATTAVPKPQASAGEAATGYQATAHVLKYYKTTEV